MKPTQLLGQLAICVTIGLLFPVAACTQIIHETELATNDSKAMTMKLTSPAFQEGQSVPPKYTGLGDDVSPPLKWSGAPDGTKSFAIICDDPDAPSRANPRAEGPWVHWVIYNLPSDCRELPAGIPQTAEVSSPVVAQQGRNSFDKNNVGYRGPLPPPGSGPHRYRFHLYALDDRLDLPTSTATKESLLLAMEGHILDQAELIGMFEQKR